MRMRPLAVISQEEIDERLREKAEKRVPHMDYEMPESVNLSFLRRSIIYHLIRGEIDQLGSTVETLARHFKEDELVTVYNAMFAVSRGDYETSQSLINGIDLLQDSDVSWLAAETVRLLYLHGGVEEDYVVQFLAEAVLISVTGGFIGVFFGVIMAKLIEQLAGIMTIVSFFSVFIAFGVSAAVGVIFGYSPAKRASEKDPIESLRYE